MQSVRLTSDRDPSDRQREDILQGARTFPDRHVLLKVMQGPFRLTGGTIEGRPGYRIFVHAVQLGVVNLDAGDTCYESFWYGFQDGSPVFLARCNVNMSEKNVQNLYFPLDVLLDEGTGLHYGHSGEPFTYTSIATYQWVRDGEE